MEWRCRLAGAGQGSSWPAEERLDRVLVAGLMLEVLLEAPAEPRDPQARRRQVKARVQESLVSHLAGHITLDRFRRLAGHLSHWFCHYYPLIAPAQPEPPDQGGPGGGGESFARGSFGPAYGRSIREPALARWLQDHAGLLPQRRHAKLSEAGLREFLAQSRGAWFGLKDFQRHFDIDRKTAWEYVQKFRRAGLLTHNQGRSAAVRFCLAEDFLI